MKILLAYIATSNYFGQLEKTMEHQLKFSEWEWFDKLVISDTRIPGSISLPSQTINPWVDRRFCISRARNAAIEHAHSHGYEWLAIVDSDAVIPNFPTVFPDSGFARVNMYRTRQNETPAELWVDPAKQARRQRAWCLLGRKQFAKRFHDEFLGSGGYEQIDFLHNVMNDVKPGDTDLAAIHLWHPIRWQEASNDKSLFLRRLDTTFRIL